MYIINEKIYTIYKYHFKNNNDYLIYIDVLQKILSRVKY